jgi:hypothetical protein
MRMLRKHGARDPGAAARPHVVFTVGGVAFAFDAAHARYVLRAGEAPTDATRFLGRAYPLLDLRRVFGHPAPERTGFVLLVEADARAGLHVDDLQGLRSLDPARLEPLPAVYRGSERRWVAGLATVDDAVLVVVRVRELLATLLADDRPGEAP